MYSEIASIFFLRICFFFCPIKQRRSPKSSKAKLLRKSLSISHRRMRVGAEPQVTTETPLTWMLPFTFISIRDKKKNIGHKTQKILFTAFWNKWHSFSLYSPWRHFANDFYYSMFIKVRSVCCSLLWRLCPSYHNFWYKARRFFILKLDPRWRLKFKLIR